MSRRALMHHKVHDVESQSVPNRRGLFNRFKPLFRSPNLAPKRSKVNSRRPNEDEDVCSGMVDLFNEEKHKADRISSRPVDGEYFQDNADNETSKFRMQYLKLPWLALTARYRKMKEEDARISKIRKHATQFIEEDNLEGLLQLIAEENKSNRDMEELTLESQCLSDPKKNMTLLHSALEDNRSKISTYLIQNGSGDYLMKTFTNLEIQIPPSCKSTLHILAEQGNLELTELLLVKLRKQYPTTHPPFQALIKPIITEVPIDKVKKFVNMKVATKILNVKTRMNPAHLAAINGHPKIMALLAKHEVDLDAEDSGKETPLMWAVMKGDLETFKELIKLGVKLNSVNKFQCSALHLAISNEQIEMTEILINNPNTDLNLERIKKPRWIIEMIAQHNYVQLMKKLMKLNNRSRINKSSIEKALLLASKEGFEDIIEAILNENKNLINAVDNVGNTPVMIATENGQLSAVKLLLETFSADLTAKNNFNETVYDMAVHQKSVDLVKYIMDQGHGNNICIPDYLHSAAASGDIEKLDFIINAGTKLLEPDINDNTILHIAAEHNNHQVLLYYLHKDDDLSDLQNRDGETPLHISVRKGNVDCVKALLSMNARTDICDKKNHNPLHVGVTSAAANEEIISLLVEKMKETYISLLNEQDCDGNTALHLSAFYRREELMHHLIDIDPEVDNNDGETALHVAIKNGTSREVNTLLKLFYNSRKRNVDKKDENGHTALIKSIETGDSEKVEQLLKYGADITLRGVNGSTSMHQMIICNRNKLSFSDKYIAIYYTIVKWSVEWYCNKEGLKKPIGKTNEYFFYQMNAVRYLTSEFYHERCNALQFASKLGTCDLLKAMLQTKDVYKFTYESKFSLPCVKDNQCLPIPKHRRILGNFLEDKNRAFNKALFDVTHLIPMTECKTFEFLILEVYFQFDKKIESRVQKTSKSCLEFIVNTNDDNYINEALGDEPFRYMISNYWVFCRRNYEILMWLHVTFMILFTYFTMPTYDFLNYRFHILSNLTETDNSNLEFHSVNYLGFFLIWPLSILLFEIAIILYYLSTTKTPIELLRKDFFGKRKISDITSGLMRIPVGTMLFIFENLSHISSLLVGVSSITWFIMAVYSSNPHAYLESLSIVLIFGWLHTINYVKGFKDWNYLASILKEILIKDITRFIYIYIFVLISFGYAIHALIQADYHLNPDGRHPTSTIYLTFYRMLSPDNILDVSEEKEYAESGGSIAILRSISAAYSILSTVVLLNMLIAMMNSTYSDVKNNISMSWRIESLKMALWFEQRIPLLRRWNFLGFSIELDHEQNRWYMSKHINPDQTHRENVQKKRESKKEDDDVEHEIFKNNERVDKLSQVAENLSLVVENLSLQVENLKKVLTEKENYFTKTTVNELNLKNIKVHDHSLEAVMLENEPEIVIKKDIVNK